MAYTTSYDTLVADLQDIVDSNNAEFVAQIPSIIARAQDNVQRDLGLEMWRSLVPASTVSLQATMTRNQGWLEVRSMFIPSLGRYLEKRKLDYVRMYGTTQSSPKYWAEESETQFRLAPIPDGIYTLDIEVLLRLPNLGPSNQTNWLTTHVGDILLLACLIGSELYLMSSERVAEFKAFYDSLLSAAVRELRDQERSGYIPTRAASFPTTTAGATA